MDRETDGDDDECHKVAEAKAISDSARFMRPGCPSRGNKRRSPEATTFSKSADAPTSRRTKHDPGGGASELVVQAHHRSLDRYGSHRACGGAPHGMLNVI
jgi:hypothetical protein